MKNPTLFTLFALLLPLTGMAADVATPTISSRVQTQKIASGKANAAAIVLDSNDLSKSLIVGTSAINGLEVYGLDGRRQQTLKAGDVASVDVAYDVKAGNATVTLLAIVDTSDNRLRLYDASEATPAEISARTIKLGFAAEGVCLYRQSLDGALFAFIVGDGGELDQHMLYANAAGKLDARHVRRINLPSPLKQCVVSSDGGLYAAEEDVGIWRFEANPEADLAPRLIDTPRLGQLAGEVGGIALHDGGEGHRWLLASDPAASRINVYDRSRDDSYAGSFQVTVGPDGKAIKAPGVLFASNVPLDPTMPNGAVLIGENKAGRYHVASLRDVADALKLDAGTPNDPRGTTGTRKAVVTALVQTVPVASYGDAADDPAIWANATDPASSLVVATDKKGGLYLYDMHGKVVQFLPVGKVNNVDLRENFKLGDESIVLVTASNRTDRTIGIYRLDTVRRELIDIADGPQPTGFNDPYGLCMSQDSATSHTYVFINGDDTRKRQWELIDAGNGRVRAKLAREFKFDSQTEGCVADDESGVLYVNEEDVALWRMSAKPDGGEARTVVQRIADNPAVKDDFEGIGIYHLGKGRGYIVLSSQGNDSYAVYRLEGKQEYLGSFSVVADPLRGIDGISETDGLEITSRSLGPGFESGAMIAQDGRKVMPVANQNYKYVPWSSIARVLNLESRKN